MEKLLVVEAVQDVRNQLKSELGREYTILEGTDRAGAMELFLKHYPKVVLVDLGLPPDPEGSAEGMRCLEGMISMRPATKVVVLTPLGEQEKAYRALRNGAYDFHQKPVLAVELQVIIRRAFQLCSLEEQSCELKEALERTTAGIEGIAGQCVALQRLFSPRQMSAIEVAEPAAEAVAFGAGSLAETHPLGGGVTAAQLWEQTGGRAPQVAAGKPSARHLTLREARDRVGKWMVNDAIGNCGGNLSKASELLGVSRPALYDLIKKYGIRRSAVRG